MLFRVCNPFNYRLIHHRDPRMDDDILDPEYDTTCCWGAVLTSDPYTCSSAD